MRDHQDIAFNVTGQSFYLDCPEGQPSSVTSVSVFHLDEGDNSTAESATTGTASVDSVDTVVDADSGESSSNPHVLNLNSTSGIEVGRSYVVTGSGSWKEWVEVAEISSGVSVTVRAPLANDYVAGNAFQSPRISISVDSTWVADASNLSLSLSTPQYRIRWEYVVGGSTYVRYSYADLVRAPATHGVKPIDIERMVPGFINALPTLHRDDRGASMISEAYDQVAIDLYEQDIGDELVQHGGVMAELVKRKTIVLWAEARAMTGGDFDAVEVARTAYQARWDQLVRAPSRVKLPVADNSGAAGLVPSQGLTRR